MRYKTILLVFFTLLALIILFGIGVGLTTAFIMNKLSDDSLWIILTILVVVSFIFLVRSKLKNNKEQNWKKHRYFELGRLLFNHYSSEFEEFYSEVQQKRKLNSRPIDALHDFADRKGLCLTINWSGEENEGEIESFIGSLVNNSISWTNTTQLRNRRAKVRLKDEEYMIGLFKSIDKDLKSIDKKLLFLNTDTDS